MERLWGLAGAAGGKWLATQFESVRGLDVLPASTAVFPPIAFTPTSE
jgi:hypothetical protein